MTKYTNDIDLLLVRKLQTIFRKSQTIFHQMRCTCTSRAQKHLLYLLFPHVTSNYSVHTTSIVAWK